MTLGNLLENHGSLVAQSLSRHRLLSQFPYEVPSSPVLIPAGGDNPNEPVSDSPVLIPIIGGLVLVLVLCLLLGCFSDNPPPDNPPPDNPPPKPIPEPSSLLGLMIFGGVLMLSRRRK